MLILGLMFSVRVIFMFWVSVRFSFRVRFMVMFKVMF